MCVRPPPAEDHELHEVRPAAEDHVPLQVEDAIEDEVEELNSEKKTSACF